MVAFTTWGSNLGAIYIIQEEHYFRNNGLINFGKTDPEKVEDDKEVLKFGAEDEKEEADKEAQNKEGALTWGVESLYRVY